MSQFATELSPYLKKWTQVLVEQRFWVILLFIVIFGTFLFLRHAQETRDREIKTSSCLTVCKYVAKSAGALENCQAQCN
jgi:hypothetical protein